ncbi:WD domain, G-beta repeat containing protein [Coccidioides posadasii C735 delta SOWgp]|uniref:Uncharacterized protein n=2 Tax=Coccidioides posadasii TaxID=199306 RepID=A0A0J6FDJ6_COCPO|nr:WD domain, G-beta repeat containing protein [Coccidioides posadasii C735 delta SOWgp]EER27497.1 WD domain, G-beta repeat containing protein [Coccidioides posadasii C735 delta SOWgp]KMM67340.1 hypothetical protein CPAG_03675 [Coccidioides posadasii RMSCC 3488]|eukprot:XP_003069642.1 WD domain, G-beta repeat containing protein [Coccidioides posadasii C735 delta SOWgp]
MKARRGGLSLGEGFRAAQRERNSYISAQKAQPGGRLETSRSKNVVDMNATSKDQRQIPRDFTSPERDDFDESDLDSRRRLLLRKFTSHHLPSSKSPVEIPKEEPATSPPNLLKRRADSISKDIEGHGTADAQIAGEIEYSVASAQMESRVSPVQESREQSKEIIPPFRLQTYNDHFNEPNGHQVPVLEVSEDSIETGVCVSRRVPDETPLRNELPPSNIQFPQRTFLDGRENAITTVKRSPLNDAGLSNGKECKHTKASFSSSENAVRSNMAGNKILKWIDSSPLRFNTSKNRRGVGPDSFPPADSNGQINHPNIDNTHPYRSIQSSINGADEGLHEGPKTPLSGPCFFATSSDRLAEIVEIHSSISPSTMVGNEPDEVIDLGEPSLSALDSSNANSDQQPESLYSSLRSQKQPNKAPDKVSGSGQLAPLNMKSSLVQLDGRSTISYSSSFDSTALDKRASEKPGGTSRLLCSSSSNVMSTNNTLDEYGARHACLESHSHPSKPGKSHQNNLSVSPPTTSAPAPCDSDPLIKARRKASSLLQRDESFSSCPSPNKINRTVTPQSQFQEFPTASQPKTEAASFSAATRGIRWKNKFQAEFNHSSSTKSAAKTSKPQMLDSIDASATKAPVRRSTRHRNAPINYYARPQGFHRGRDIPELAIDELEESTPEPLPEATTSPNRVAAKPATQHKVVYQCRDFHITREPLLLETTHSIAEKIDQQHVPYFDRGSRDDPSKFFGSDIVHVDFDLSEMNAMYSILTDSGPVTDDDIPIQAVVSHAVISFASKGGDLDTFGRRIHYLRAIKRYLRHQKLAVGDFLIQAKSGNVDGIKSMKPKIIEKLSRCLTKVFNIQLDKYPRTPLAKLGEVLTVLKIEWLHKMTTQCRHLDNLLFRDMDDIQRFLKDAKEEVLNPFPSLLRIVEGVSQCHLRFDDYEPLALLRSRELGYSTHRNRIRISRRLEDVQNWELWKSWTGASNDVLVLSWSPDSTRFAAGAAAQTDDHNMQYNRNNNLLLGDLTVGRLKELPDHRIERPVLDSGPNSHSTYIMVDPNLYMTVTAMHWTNCGNHLYTASFDKTVKLWDVSSHEDARCINTLRHHGRVQEMAISEFDNRLVATGCDGPSFLLWRAEGDECSESTHLEFRRDKCAGMTPSSLQWGRTSRTNRFLVGGLTSEDPSNTHDPSKFGYLTLWQVGEAAVSPLNITPNTQNIFDVAWHPSLNIFATGCTVPSAARSHGYGSETRSLVRIYDPLNSKWAIHCYDCPALDINQVTFCPADEDYMTASCTDGVTYVWDYRNPKAILHKLRHGEPISDLNQDLRREQADVGVRCSVWGKGFEFYTGASDGIVKRWDIRLAPEDVFRENVASFNQELMCASMSPDYTNMVFGDASGGIHVISTSPWGRSDDNFSSFDFERAPQAKSKDAVCEESISGIQEAAKLISSGELLAHPIFGPGQGPHYNGPYAAWARPEKTLPEEMAFTPLKPEVQATQFRGPPLHERRGLDKQTRERLAKLVELSATRNRRHGKNKRKRDGFLTLNSKRTVAFQPRSTPYSSRKIDAHASFNSRPRSMPWSSSNQPKHKQVKPAFKVDPSNFIDLTLDSNEEGSVQEICLSEFNKQPDNKEENDEFEEDHWWPVNVHPNF